MHTTSPVEIGPSRGVAPCEAEHYRLPQPTPWLWLALALMPALFVASAVFTYHNVSQWRATEEWVSHTREVQSHLTQLLSHLHDVETGALGFLLTGELELLEPYRVAMARVQPELQKIKTLSGDNLAQQRRLAEVDGVIEASLQLRRARVQEAQQARPETARPAMSLTEDKRHMAESRRVLAEVEAEEEGLLQGRLQAAAAKQRQVSWILGGFTAAMALIVVWGQWLLRLYAQERRRAERNLLDQLRLTQAITDNAADSIFVTDADGRVSFMNREAQRTFGFTADEVVGQVLHDTIHHHYPDGRPFPSSECPMGRVYRFGDTVHDHEAVFFRSDGSTLRVACSNAPLQLDGRRAGSVLIVRDMSERKRAEEDIARLASFPMLNPNPIVETDLEGRVQFINPAARRLFPDLEQVGPGHPWFTHWRSTARIFAEATTQQAVREVVVGERCYQQSLYAVTVEGIRRIRIYGLDVTARKRAETALRENEEKYEVLIETTDTGYVILDAQGCVVDANPEYVRLTGHSSLEQVLGRSVTDWVAGHDQVRNAEQVRSCMERGQVRNLEIDYVSPNGEIKPIEINASVLIGAGGRRIVGLCRDISERRQAQEALRESETKHRRLFEEALDGIVLADAETGILLDCNRALCSLLGRERAELIGRPQQILHPPEANVGGSSGSLAQHQATPDGEVREAQVMTSTGRIKEVEIKSSGYGLRGRRVVQGIVRDVTGRKLAERALFAEKELCKVTLHCIGDAVITTDAAGMVEYLNPVAQALTGWPLEEARGEPLEQVFVIVNEDTRERAINPATRCLAEGRICGLANHTTLISRYGQECAIQDSAAPIRNHSGEMLGVVIVFSDVTEQRRLSRAMSHQASHDSLTGLINRAEFERRLRRALDTVSSDGSEHALCYLDLDQFKIINDTCGHVAGDALLRELSAALKEQIRQRDTFARLGGDEFGVLVECCSAQDALRVANALRKTVEEYRFVWNDRRFNIGVSIGLVPINGASGDLAGVLSAADSACYMAKERGRNRIHVYQEDDAELAQRHGEMQWAARLPQALAENRFDLCAQPIRRVEGSDAEPEHYELLLRMRDEAGNMIMPDAFLPSAERYNLSPQLDRWVIAAALRWLTARPERIERLGLCSINLSGISLCDQDFLAFVIQQFESGPVAPAKICFEITETAAIANLSYATRFIKALKVLGCSFALDDFGSGLSSFAYLKNLPVDFLKIDGGFVKDIADDAISFAMVKSINDIGHVMGMQTIAEFVESDAILDRLRAIGVDYAQGFVVGGPALLQRVAAPGGLEGRV